jgi:SNF family Na+-dependent transporter
MVAVYYNMVIAWAVFYFFSSFASVLPWSKDPSKGMNSTTFWQHDALGMSLPSDDPDRYAPTGMVWHMVFYLALVCLLCWAAVLRGVETSGKVWKRTPPYGSEHPLAWPSKCTSHSASYRSAR